MKIPRRGILLCNIGSPDAPEPPAVARYLRQFLSDPRVIDIPALWRWILVNILIVPRRSKTSAEAYRSIWTERGSPLVAHSQDLAAALQDHLGDGTQVRAGMRYGSPSLADAVAELRAGGATEIITVPMFPQYAESSTESAVDALKTIVGSQNTVVPPFFTHPGFIQPVVEGIKRVTDAHPVDHLLLSYHGLPVRQVARTCNAASHCGDAPCPARHATESRCYRAQAFETSRALAASLGLSDDDWTVAFQSRLGRTPWITPHTDQILGDLRARGFETLAVACPSFVADCLETIEEIGMRLAEDWRALGGKALHLVPCVNSDPAWVAGLAAIVDDAHTQGPRP